MHEPGIGTEPAGQVVNHLVTPDGFGKPAAAVFPCGEFGQLALVIRLERCAVGIHFRQVARHFRRVDAGIEIG
jgi:hypothetical protein